MAAWIVVPSLGQLRTDLNRLAPNRDKTSDGTLGDDAHKSRVSDHNDDEIGRVPIRDADSKHEVHAIDLDANLNVPNLTMEMVVQHVVGRCRSGAEKRLRYVIYDRRIWERSNGWKQRGYNGDNPHLGWAHFSGSYESEHEADTASWRLEDIPVALTDADKKWLEGKITAAEKRIRADLASTVDDFLNIKTGDKAVPGRTVGDVLRDFSKLRGALVGDKADTKNAAIPQDAPISRAIAAADVVLRVDADQPAAAGK
jgi:hypothetical protein